MLAPIHRWIWRDRERRVQKLLRFGETETDGGRDLLRAAEVTSDPLLRRLFLLHATDEQRHGAPDIGAERLAPAGHGLDDLRVEEESDDTMLAFLHLSEKSAASRFTVYRDALGADPDTQGVFTAILHDEMFHMNYTLTQLLRVAPKRHRSHLWRARLSRLWKAYLRLASAIAGVLGGLLLMIQYFVLLPAFAWIAKRAAAREPIGWSAVPPERNEASLRRQY